MRWEIVVGAYPRGWSAYRAYVARGDLEPSTRLARFAARYRMARLLTRVEFDGLSTRTEEAYAAVLRVAMAYSALETLEGTPGISRKSIKVVDLDVSTRVRDPRHRQLRVFLESPAVSKELRGRVGRLLSTNSQDVRPAAEVVRNAFFHGELTVHGAGVATSPSLLLLMRDLARAVLDAANHQFADWLESQVMDEQ